MKTDDLEKFVEAQGWSRLIDMLGDVAKASKKESARSLRDSGSNRDDIEYAKEEWDSFIDAIENLEAPDQ